MWLRRRGVWGLWLCLEKREGEFEGGKGAKLEQGEGGEEKGAQMWRRGYTVAYGSGAQRLYWRKTGKAEVYDICTATDGEGMGYPR